MAKLNDIYKCEICGNIVEVVHGSGGTLNCCSKPMTKVVENTVDAAKEKHIPVVEIVGDKVVVKVGDVEHPMSAEHYIEYIEVETENNELYKKFLNPEDKPVATFKIDSKVKSVKAYCNLHGLWTNNNIA